MRFLLVQVFTWGFFYLAYVGVKTKLRERAERKALKRNAANYNQNLPVPTIDGGVIHGVRIDPEERSPISYGS